MIEGVQLEVNIYYLLDQFVNDFTKVIIEQSCSTPVSHACSFSKGVMTSRSETNQHTPSVFSGTPAVVYLFLNQTIQQEVLQLLKNVRKYSGSSISTASDAAVYKLSTDSQFRLHGKDLSESRIFRIVPQRLAPASKL